MFASTAIILAGGAGSRMNGSDKARIVVDTLPIIERNVQLLSQWFAEVLIVSNSSRRYEYPGVRSVCDEQPGCGPLMGLYSGLRASGHALNFVTACDMPYLNELLVRFMMDKAESDGTDVVVPIVEGYPEPLMAVYNQRVLPVIDQNLQADRRKMTAFFDEVRVHAIPETQIAAIDPQRYSFVNINTPEDLARAREVFPGVCSRRVS